VVNVAGKSLAAQSANHVGVVRRALYCDESGISADHSFYGFGALIMGYQRRGEFAALAAELRKKHRAPADEIKWTKTKAKTFPFYRALVDYFFQEPSMFFHCMLVERAWVNTRLCHGGSFDLARRKHFTKFLADKVGRIKQKHRGRELEVRVYVDKIPSSYAKAGEVMEIVGNRMINKLSPLVHFAEKVDAINSLTECDSHDYLGIQLCDLLLGAVVDTWNDRSRNEFKSKLKTRIAWHLGWEDLSSDTMPEERKFNVWRLTDQVRKGERPVKTRPTNLRKPLPGPQRRG
jgi:hypothetical protein